MRCSPQFWRMAVLWAISLLYSYLLLFLGGRTTIYRRRRQMPGAGRRPICVVTGALEVFPHLALPPNQGFVSAVVQGSSGMCICLGLIYNGNAAMAPNSAAQSEM